LKHGININNLTLPKVKVERLYIKLDKKLIVSADKIKIKRESRSSTSAYEINKTIKYLKYLQFFFDSISLRNITYNDEVVNILYKDDVFYVDSKFLTIDAKVSKIGKKIHLDLKQMILKDYGLELVGNLDLDIKDEIYKYSGKYSILNIDGGLSAKIKGDKLYYDINSSTFDSLSPIMKYLKKKVFIEPLAREWIYKKIVAKKYKLNYLRGMFDFKTKDFFPKLMEGVAVAKDVLIKFHPHVKAAKANSINVTLKNNTLIFYPKEPTYEKKKVGINDIYIYNLLTTKNGIVVDIKSDTLLDAYVHNILRAFNIHIPVIQTSGKNRSNLLLDVRFKPFSIKSKGTFEIFDSNFSIAGIDFFTKHANIKLDNNNVFLDNSNLKYKNIFDINTTGKFDTKSSNYKGSADINSLLIDIKNSHLLNIYNLKNKNVKLDFGTKKTSVFLKDFETKLVFQKNNNIFEINNLLKYKPFSSFLKDQKFSKGKLKIFTKQFNTFDADLNVSGINTPFVDGAKSLKSFNVKIDINGSVVKAHTTDDKFNFTYDKNIILNLKDIDILVDSNSTKTKTDKLVSINGKDVRFVSKDFNTTISSDNFTLNFDQNETRFISVYKNSQLGYESNATSFKANGSKFDDSFINGILNKKMFKGGVFSFNLKGNNANIFDGKVFIKNSILKDFAVFNNIIATINTIPSLFLFKDPNFNEHGYAIKKGVVTLKRINNIIAFENIDLKGFSANISGSGYIDLATKEINLDLQIKTLKDISKFISSIPLVGYITLGEDKSISTNIEVVGKIQNPKIKTQILRDSLISPLNIIKRVIKSPLKLFQ
jgi:hypothetical protein